MGITGIKGSLTQVRKTCGVPGCKKCASGEKHTAWLFVYRLDGKTCTKHVPKYAVEEFRHLLEEGKAAERQLVCNGIEFLNNLKKKSSR